MTHYIDLFRTLNPELHTHDHPVTDSVPYDTVSRNKLVVDDSMQRTLQNNFLWKPLMFEGTHEVRFPKPIVCVSGSGTPVLDVHYLWCTEYFHFLTEVLPNLLFLDRYYPSANIRCGTSPFTLPLLRWFGVRGSIVQAIEPNMMRVEAPFVECGNPSPFKLGLLRDKVKQKVTFEKTHGILIRRHKTRELLNEADVFRHLQRKFPHLVWTIFDALSVDDTVALFSKAAVIAGPHGAGFTNMIFSSEGTQIIEFMPTKHPNVCYWHLSEMLKNPYTMIPCTTRDLRGNMTVTLTNTWAESLF